MSQEEEPEKFSDIVEIDLVNVYVSATDSRGNAVKNLKQEELVLKEDKVVQEITYFSILGTEVNDVPIAVALVIDVSNSMNEGTKEMKKIDIAKGASREVIQLMRPLDQVMLVAFDTRIQTKTELSSNPAETELALVNLRPSYGRTALWDAIHAASEALRQIDGRRIMLICSDGLDNASTVRQEQAISKDLVEGDITAIALGTIEFERKLHWHGEEVDYREGKKTMQLISDSTGGYAFFPKRTPELDEILQKVRSGVWNWYSIAYRSSNPEKDGSWRKIEIDAKRKGVHLRYREGYYAEP